MKNKKKLLLVLASFCILLIGSISFYVDRKKTAHLSQLVIYGNVDIRQVDLGFRVFGRVSELFVDEGDCAVTGQPLACLDPTPYKLAAERSLAAIAAIESNLENAIFKFERRDEMSQAAVSDEEYDDALFTVETLYNNLAEAKATYNEDLLHISDCTILSPADGTIITRVREPGSIMNTSDTILTLSLDTPVWIRAYVNEKQLGTIYPGMKAHVTTDSDPNTIINAHIGYISPVAEFTPKSVETTTLRTELVYRLRVIVDNPPKTLRQGMPVTVTLLGIKN